MSFQQLVTPNPNISCQPGMCLQYVRQAFGAPLVEPTATEGWNKAQYKHTDYDFPAGVWVPLWFAIPGVPAGHVVLMAPDGSIYSTSDNSNVPHHHPSLADLIWYYGPRVQPQYQLQLQYLGWSEDISTVRVVQEASIQTESITIQEDILDMATPEQLDRLLAAADRINGVITDPNAKVLTTANLSDIADAVTHKDIPWFGFDGQQPTAGRTTVTLADIAAWSDTAWAGMNQKLVAMQELVKQLSVAQGVTIDYAAIAKAVNDDAATRMKG